MKRLALFLDGTWNTVESATNVSRLHDIVANSDGPIAQQCYYDQGVGTRQFEWLRGGALGYGLNTNIVQAYDWLRERYADGDQIFIFGFSRGAYTARSLAGLIAKCGLLRANSTIDSGDLFHRYQLSANKRPIYTLEWVQLQAEPLSEEEHELLAQSRRVPIRFIGVWDTVGSLGIPFGNIPGLSRRRFQFHHTRPSNLYEQVCHALAIDEHRKSFAPTLWTRFKPKVPDPPTGLPVRTPVVEQRWFVGAHADVGGGYPTRLSQHALAWMARKAQGAGLAMTEIPAPTDAATTDPIADSYAEFMWGLYRIAKLGKRHSRIVQRDRLEKDEGFVETVNETIDASVFDRFRRDPKYRPANLLAWARGRKVDPAALQVSVRADDASVAPDR